MTRGPDAGALLGRALVAAADEAGCPVRIEAAVARAWHSATFAGANHMITLSAEASPRLDRWLGVLREADFALTGHLVADIGVDSIRTSGERCEVDLAALTVADAS